MRWFVELTANGRSEAEEHPTLDSAKVAFKRGKKLFMNLAEMTPDLKVSGSITQFDGSHEKLIDFFDNTREVRK